MRAAENHRHHQPVSFSGVQAALIVPSYPQTARLELASCWHHIVLLLPLLHEPPGQQGNIISA